MLLAILFSLSVVLRESPEMQSASTPCTAQEIYEQFLIVQSGREQVVRRHRIEFTERHVLIDDNKPIMAVAGHFDVDGDCEKWVRWEISGRVSSEIHQIHDRAQYSDRIRNSLRPRFSMTDGVRTVQLGPDRSQPNHWEGILEDGLIPVIRRGALHCGIMSSQMWLTDYLKLSAPADCALGSDGLLRLTLVPRRETEGEHFIDLYLDDDLFCRTITKRTGDFARVEAHVDSTSLLDGELVPATGRLITHYSVSVELRATLSYSAGQALPRDSFLDELPSEIHQIGGSATVMDETSRTLKHLVPPDERDEAHLPSLSHPDPNPPAEPKPLREHPPDGNLIRTAALAVAAVAALSLLIALRRR